MLLKVVDGECVSRLCLLTEHSLNGNLVISGFRIDTCIICLRFTPRHPRNYRLNPIYFCYTNHFTNINVTINCACSPLFLNLWVLHIHSAMPSLLCAVQVYIYQLYKRSAYPHHIVTRIREGIPYHFFCFYRTQVSLGSDLCVQLSLTNKQTESNTFVQTKLMWLWLKKIPTQY